MNYSKLMLLFIKLKNLKNRIYGDWGLGSGDWGLGPIPQTPKPKPKTPNPKKNILNIF